jgi:phytoene desaturase
VVVIGGGLAGLAAACELAARGLRVTVVERNEHLGGKMNVLTAAAPSGPLAGRPFRFDMGPTIITLPQVLLGIIGRCGRDAADYLELVNLDPQWRCFYEDGARIDVLRDPALMREQLDRLFPEAKPGRSFERFVRFSRRMLGLSEKVFFYKDVGGVMDMMGGRAGGASMSDPRLLGDVLAMRMHKSMAGTVHSMIREPHVRQLVEHFLQYVGSSPFLAPAILSLIAAAQLDHGCWYPMGGTGAVAGSLARIGAELGVEYRAGTSVERMVIENGRAAGVEARGDGGRGPTEIIRADAVVSNCDVQRTLKGLLDTPAAAARSAKIARDYSPACSGVVLYLGLSRRYDHLAHHNFLFSRDSHAEFDDIYRRGEPARDPTLYLAAPSRTDPAQAPPGCESLYILVHTPYLRPGHRWLEDDGTPGPTLRAYRPVIIEKLRRFGMDDVEQRIAVERALTPAGIDRMYNAEGGAIYGLASHGRFKGGFKPRNRSGVLPNLYLAGGSVNPGPGVPMVLMSGVTAANAVLEDLGVDPSPRPGPAAAPPTTPEADAWATQPAMAG